MLHDSPPRFSNGRPRMGGLGLFLLAALDSSFLSFPQVNDLLIIFLSTRYPARMPYYAGMTTVGSLIGCFALYRGRVARRRGISSEAIQRHRGSIAAWPCFSATACSR